MSDHNECPTCTQDWVEKTDYECGCCGRPASEHIRVTSLCRILRETQQREHKERALADLLASSLLLTLSAWITSPEAERAAASLRVWKEARKEARNEI